MNEEQVAAFAREGSQHASLCAETNRNCSQAAREVKGFFAKSRKLGKYSQQPRVFQV
jgi:hypothetical protein